MKHEEPFTRCSKEGERNWNNKPRMITDCDAMGAPLCPSCGEWSYYDERCPFCGQLFISPTNPVSANAQRNSMQREMPWDDYDDGGGFDDDSNLMGSTFSFKAPSFADMISDAGFRELLGFEKTPEMRRIV